MALKAIRGAHGPAGVDDLIDGRFTDDTQMTIFTVEGLLRAHNRGIGRGIVSIPAVVHRAYLRWLTTQGAEVVYDEDFALGLPTRPRSAAHAAAWSESWLLEVPELQATRAPGSTCLSALRSGRLGTPDRPINNSKGCGGIMPQQGRDAIPAGWLERLELRDLIEELALDLYRHFGGEYLAIGEEIKVRGISRADGAPFLTVEHDMADFDKYPGY